MFKKKRPQKYDNFYGYKIKVHENEMGMALTDKPHILLFNVEYLLGLAMIPFCCRIIITTL